MNHFRVVKLADRQIGVVQLDGVQTGQRSNSSAVKFDRPNCAQSNIHTAKMTKTWRHT